MRRVTAVLLSLALTGCAGSAPRTIPTHQPGDEKRSCKSLVAEIAANEDEIIKLTKEKNKTLRKNVGMGIVGALIVVPWFFMDLKGREAAEMRALRHRNKILRNLAAGKKCDLPAPKVKFEEKGKNK